MINTMEKFSATENGKQLQATLAKSSLTVNEHRETKELFCHSCEIFYWTVFQPFEGVP